MAGTSESEPKWGQILPRVVENAKSGRSLCGVCKLVIEQGTKRVGVQKWAGKYIAVTWHHPTCIDVMPIGSKDFALAIPEKSFDARDARTKFSKAARYAIRAQVDQFRTKQFERSETLICPISKTVLTPDTSHVHHFGPHTFESIVKSFLSEKNIDLKTVSITAGQFSNDNLATAFSEYHRNKARFLLVSPKANLSTLKTIPSMGPCDLCGRTSYHLTWVFTFGVCKRCMKSKRLYAKFCSQKHACWAFCLVRSDLVTLQFQSLPNPKNSGFAPMKLFKIEDVQRIASEKHGSVDAALKKRKLLNARARRTRLSYHNAAATFSMTLRNARHVLNVQDVTIVSIASHDGDPSLATPAQLRYLMQLRAPRVIGVMSKSLATQKIKEYKEGKKRRAAVH